MANWLYFILALVLSVLGITYFFGAPWGTTVLLLSLFVVLLAGKFYKPLQILPKRMSTVSLVVVGLLTFMMGGFSILSPMLSPSAVTASFTGAASVSPLVDTSSSMTAGDCWAKANSEIRGTTTTVTYVAYDYASNSPGTTTIGVSGDIYDAETGEWVNSFATTGSGATVSLMVGKTYNFVGGNASTYMLDKKGVCIEGQTQTVALKAYKAATVSNLKTTILNGSATGTEANKGTNASQEDYAFTLGANEDTGFGIQLKVNAANVAYQVGGLAVRVLNDIDDCRPTGSEWTKTFVPKNLKSTISLEDGPGIANISNYDDVYVLSNAVLMTQWEQRAWSGVIEAGATDPANSQTPGSGDYCILCFLDASNKRGDNGVNYFDVYQHDSAEGDVGIADRCFEPIGGQNGVVIEGA